MTLAERIQQRMDTIGINQAELARRTGISPPSVNAWLSGDTKALKAATMMRLATVLQCRPEWLNTGMGLPTLDEMPYRVMEEGAWRPVAYAPMNSKSSAVDLEIGALLASMDPHAKMEVLQWLRGFCAGRKSSNGG